MMSRRFALFAGFGVLLGALATGCGGNGVTQPVFSAQPTPSAIPTNGGSATLQVVLTVPKTATAAVRTRLTQSVSSAARGLDVYAYQYPGPSATPNRSLVGAFDISAGSPRCSPPGSGGRTCTLSMPAPAGRVTIHSEVWDTVARGAASDARFVTRDGNRLGSTEAVQNLAANAVTTVNVITDATPASLAMSVSPSALATSGPITVTINALDANNNAIANDYPVAIFAPGGAVTANGTPGPAVPILNGGAVAYTNGSTTFTYNGNAVNPMTVVAIAGTFSQTAQVLPFVQGANPACPLAYTGTGPLAALTQNPFANGMSSGAGFFTDFTIDGKTTDRAQLDTGSELFILKPQDVADANAGQAIGPGEPGIERLGSDTNFYAGHYYLARVTLTSFSQPAVTVPMKVMVEDVTCNSGCYNLMGVGFGRPTSTPDPQYGATYKSPVVNTLLQLQSVVQGTNALAGYTVTNKGFTAGLGAANAGAFAAPSMQQLRPDSAGRVGDWAGPQGCTILTAGNRVSPSCIPSNILLDTGLPHMLIDGFTYAAGTLSALQVQIANTAPNSTTPNLAPPAYAYAFPVYTAAPLPSPTQTPPGPPFVQQDNISPANPGTPTVNTGVQLLGGVNYLYDEVCGRAGFAPNGS